MPLECFQNTLDFRTPHFFSRGLKTRQCIGWPDGQAMTRINAVFLGNPSMLSVPRQSHACCGYLFLQIAPPVLHRVQGLSCACKASCLELCILRKHSVLCFPHLRSVDGSRNILCLSVIAALLFLRTTGRSCSQDC